MIQQQSKSTDKSAQAPIINIMRRSSVLMTIQIFSCIVFAVFSGMTGSNWNIRVTFILYFVAATLYYCYSALCIFLMLRINEKYYKCLCGICDAAFKKLCNCVAGTTDVLEQKHKTVNGIDLSIKRINSNSGVTVPV